jgi:hypothetical protein
MIRRPRARWVIAAAIAILVGLGGIAWAYWTTTGSGTASASTATLNPPSDVTATATPGSGTVPVSWTASAVSAGHVAPTGYYVTRASGSTSANACGTSPTALTTATATSCSDTSVPDGTYHYNVTAVYHSWTAASESSTNVIVVNDNVAPTVTINQAAGQADPTKTSPINFTVVFSEPVSDFATADVTLTGTAGGTAAVTGSGTNYNVAVTGMSSGTVIASIATGVAHDAAGNGNTASTSTDHTVTYDVTAPTAPAPVVTAAVSSGSFINHEQVTLTDAATDANSGVKSVSYFYCTGATGACTSSNWTAIGSSTTSAGNFPVTTSIWATAAEGSYRVVAVATDNLDNVSSPSATTLITVDTTPPTVSRPTVNGHSS